MSETEKTTLENILQKARLEFLEKGYQKASLRSIVKAAGVTTGALYGYFKNKEELFDALVKEAYSYIINRYREVLQQFAALPPEQQMSQMVPYTAHCMKEMTGYVYDHFQAFKLILCCADGTPYSNFIHDIVSMDVDATHHFAQTGLQQGLEVRKVNPYLEHMLASGMFSTYFQLVVHDVPREEAGEYISQLLDFYHAGWMKIMGF